MQPEFQPGFQPGFQIERIDDPESPELGKTQQLLEELLGKAEVDSEEILRHAVGVSAAAPGSAAGAVKYLIFNVKDAAAQVVAAVCGGILDLQDAAGHATDKTVLMVTYAVTRPGARQGGLARQAYLSALHEAAADSARRGKKLAFAAGECTGRSEPFWNKVGWQRIYKVTNQGLAEVEYIQPVLDFDFATGRPAKDTGEVPEHLMLDGFAAELRAADLISTVGAFYRWYHWSEEDFATATAFKRHSTYVKGLLARFVSQFTPDSPLKTLSQQERQQLQSEGVPIKELISI